MILDRLARLDYYLPLHPGLLAIRTFLAEQSLRDFPLGKHALDDDRLFVIVAREIGRGQEGAKLEAHRKYIDLQLPLVGQDGFGWKPTEECEQPTGPFNREKDIIFFADKADRWVNVQPEEFVIFFPHDAHAPLAAAGDVHKAVFKIAVDW